MGQPQSVLTPIHTPVRQPQPGDHIYSTRAGGLYAHHGCCKTFTIVTEKVIATEIIVFMELLGNLHNIFKQKKSDSAAGAR
ncbi:hypothetical protein QQP08_017798 [Theobroma cacao]|nr:hypothetical protein QQP08_017798 [Theobroma cacao]